jgi:hypothetical protein
MKDATSPVLSGPGFAQDALAEVLLSGAQQMLATAIEAEVAAYIDAHECEVDEGGHRLVVRNGRHRARQVHTGVGTVEVEQPRVNDKRVDTDGARFKFTSKILPPYLRRTKNLEEVHPLALPKGDLDQRLLRMPAASDRQQHRKPVDVDGCSSQGSVGQGMPGVEPAFAGRQALRLLLG